MIAIWLIFCLYSLGLRWLIFDYKKLQWFRVLLGRVSEELTRCVYCQTIECSLLVYGSLVWSDLIEFNWSSLLLGSLTNGFVAISIDGFIGSCIQSTEKYRDFPFNPDETK